MGNLRPEAYLKRLAIWFTEQPTGTCSIGRAELRQLLKSRRIVHQVTLEATRRQLLTEHTEHYVITPKFEVLIAQTKAGLRADSQLSQTTPLSEATRPEIPLAVSPESRLCDLRLNQLPDSQKTPRRAQILETTQRSINTENGTKNPAEPCHDEAYIPSGYYAEEVTLNNINIQNTQKDLESKTQSARARSTQRAMKGRKTRQSKLSAQKAKAKQLALAKARGEKATRAKPVRVVLQDETDAARVQSMAASYEIALKQYTNKPHLRWQRRAEFSPQATAMLLRAATFAEELGVDYDTYVRAQFWAFHEWFRCAPKLHELASHKSATPAKKRVQLYLDAVASGCVNPKREIRGAGMSDPQVSMEARMVQSEKQLRRFMRNYGISEEEALCKFATGRSANAYFDRQWLLENETYQRLKAEGKV